MHTQLQDSNRRLPFQFHRIKDTAATNVGDDDGRAQLQVSEHQLSADMAASRRQGRDAMKESERQRNGEHSGASESE